ncbi:MAG: hypothetical protein LBG74_08200, partial [Spirochaetaceae bacterium]|nr:hypothetical protein [Spirochaetaceae bacterium]
MAFAIDRKALISRHNPAFYAPSGNVPQTAPFSVGNGRFCFTADGTGLQSAVLCPADAHLRFPFLTMAEWYWHSYPDAPGGDLRLTPFDTYGRDVGYATDDAGQESLFY